MVDPLNRGVNALGGLLFVLLGLYVVSVDPDADENRAFGLLAAAFGLHFAVGESGVLLGHPIGRLEPWILSPLLVLASAGALWLTHALVSDATGEVRQPLLGAGAVGLVLFGAHVLIAVTHAAEIAGWVTQGAGYPWRPAGALAVHYGFFGMLTSLFVVLYGLVLAYGPDVEGPRRLEARIVTVALATYVGFVAGANPAEGTGISSGMTWSTWVAAVDLLAVVILAALWLDRSRRVPESKSARNIALYLLVIPLVGLLVQASGRYFGAYGITRTIAVVVLAYGILKHDVLGIDRKVQWGVSRTTVAGIFIAVFFVVSEGAQVLFSDVAGNEILGVLAAGALVFFLAPIQRAADELAEALVPEVGPGGEAREESFRAAVEMALADGEISDEEERRLAERAEELGLTHTEAHRVRRAVESGGDGEGA